MLLPGRIELEIRRRRKPRSLIELRCSIVSVEMKLPAASGRGIKKYNKLRGRTINPCVPLHKTFYALLSTIPFDLYKSSSSKSKFSF